MLTALAAVKSAELVLAIDRDADRGFMGAEDAFELGRKRFALYRASVSRRAHTWETV